MKWHELDFPMTLNMFGHDVDVIVHLQINSAKYVSEDGHQGIDIVKRIRSMTILSEVQLDWMSNNDLWYKVAWNKLEQNYSDQELIQMIHGTKA
jgi:hypothetical protein